MLLDVAHTGTESHVTGRWYRLRMGRSAFARLQLSQLQYRVQLHEPGKRRANRHDLVPANNSERSPALRTIREQGLKRVALSW